MNRIEPLRTRKRPGTLIFLGFPAFIEPLRTMLSPPRQESNLYRTLRRRVHYPLCYEEIGAYSSSLSDLMGRSEKNGRRGSFHGFLRE